MKEALDKKIIGRFEKYYKDIDTDGGDELELKNNILKDVREAIKELKASVKTTRKGNIRCKILDKINKIFGSLADENYSPQVNLKDNSLIRKRLESDSQEEIREGSLHPIECSEDTNIKDDEIIKEIAKKIDPNNTFLDECESVVKSRFKDTKIKGEGK